MKIPTLEKDGANFAHWKECTAKALFERTGGSAYWTFGSPKRDSKWDMAVDCCVYQVISNIITDDMGGRTAQMMTFREISSKLYDPYMMSILEYTSENDCIADKLESEGVVWTRDGIVVLIYQFNTLTNVLRKQKVIPTSAKRDGSEANPIKIPDNATANVKRGKEQCLLDVAVLDISKQVALNT
ncbi:hypothetical protein CROQUDRAFT_93472 [Cronartium quercuum f. sp. fusiforme G11]|uniref:Uncharacterized protein n=1 Tax=Cronartium quercuum f. sp. fusiforme G11 TaxID=708437 RepID=A0A9P6NLH4_9BASI|nr:hypothetical protein CROQUDRAFT_93472 [Cronartium quercuum f. sp. fusiforme G11]